MYVNDSFSNIFVKEWFILLEISEAKTEKILVKFEIIECSFIACDGLSSVRPIATKTPKNITDTIIILFSKLKKFLILNLFFVGTIIFDIRVLEKSLEG